MINQLANGGIARETAAMHLSAYNAAFYELGLRWHWDTSTCQALLAFADDRSRLRHYIETRQPHMLNAYDVDALADVIQNAKSRCFDKLMTCADPFSSAVDWAAMQAIQVGF